MEEPASATVSREALRGLLLATLAFGLCFTAMGLVAPLARKFEDDWSLSSFETSVLIAVPIILGSLLRIPMGALTDRFGGRRVFAGLLLASVPPCILLGVVDSYWALVGTALLLGIAGSSFAVGVPFVAGWFGRERQGFALGIYGMGNAGTAIAAFSAPFVVDHLGGRRVLGFGVAALLAAGALAWWGLARDAPGRPAPSGYRQVLRAGMPLYRLSLFYFVTFGGFIAMAIFTPKLLVDWFDFSLVDAGLRAAGFTAVATITRPLGGWLSDRFGAYSMLVIAFAGIAVDAAALATISPTPRIVPVTIACLSLAAFFGLGSGAVFKLVPAEFPDDTGAASGIIGAAGGLGGFFPPLLMGLVNDLFGSYTLGFVGLLAFCSVCFVVTVWLLRAQGGGLERSAESSVIPP
ncbi:MAG: MFS transporter [Thermoleophilia bacterium]|nr:MFS transporter [Thermoleophilia bacterium]